MTPILKQFLRITPLLMLAVLLLPNRAHAAGAVDHIAVTVSPRPAAVGQDIAITATAKDRRNATVTSYSGQPVLKDSSGTLSASAPGAFTNGVSTTTAQIGSAARGDVVYVTSGGASGRSAAFKVIGPVDHFDPRVTPRQVNLGSPIPLTVTARDAAGNVAESYASSGTVLWAGFDTGWLTFANGVAQTTIDNWPMPSRDFLIEVLDTSNGMYAYSNPFDVIGPPDHLEGSFKRTDHATSCASVRGNLTLKMEDAAGNVLASYNGRPDPLTLANGGGSILPGQPASFWHGVSTTRVWSLNPARPSSDSIVVGPSGLSVPIC